MKMSNQDQLKMHSPNLVDSNIEKIAALFPNCVTEAQGENGELKKAIDFDLLKQELSQVLVEGEQERYRLDWVGKKEAILKANAPIAKTLRPCREESVNFDSTENLFIEGDNLEALKLLQENYLGKVKMIYIDPPYNTGNDFIYEDDFAESTDAFFEKSNQVDEEGNRLIANTDSNGRFHSDWLSMIYSRLKLARNLLKDDGVIFISIDENEVSNLKKLGEEIFGASNFLFQITLLCNPKGRSQDKYVANCHEYILGFSKNSIKSGSLNIPKSEEEIISSYKLIDEKGRYRELELRNTHREFGEHNRPKLYYPFYVDINGNVSIQPKENSEEVFPIWDDGFKGCWTWGKPKAESQLDELLAKKIKGKWKVYRKGYALNEDGDSTKQVKSIWQDSSFYTEKGQVAFNELFKTKEKIFQSPKSVALLKQLLNMAVKNDDIVLDFFCGSGTISQAVFEFNVTNASKCKVIAIQIPEQTDEKKEAFKAGYKTIAEISKERIRRAGKKIIEDNASKEGIENLDIGFRVLKIDSTNMKDVYYTPDALKQADILDLADHIKADRSSEDLLFQVMLDWGLELSLPIELKTVAGKEVFYVAGNSLVACFDDLTFDVVDEVAKDHPLRFVSAEKAIHLDHDKTNIKERFKQLSPDTEVKFL